MIFNILGIQRQHVQLLHVADQLGAIEIAKGIAGQAELDRRGLPVGDDACAAAGTALEAA